MMFAEDSIQQRGSAKLGCLIAAGAVLLLGLILAVTFIGRYNSLVALQENTEASWSEIDNQYKQMTSTDADGGEGIRSTAPDGQRTSTKSTAAARPNPK